jgi:hypothetical protein
MARYFGVPLRNGLPIGLGSAIGLSGPVDPDFAADNIELEDGADLLLESGGLILLEGLMPTLWLDFQYSTSLDSRITFTRASTATYFNSSGVLTTAASGAARFDYNPFTLQPRGLLIEEARTNSFPNSNDFSNATYWTVYGTAVATGSAAVGPDGLTSASNLAGATNTTLSGNNLEESVSISASTAYTFSVFVKSNGGTTVVLRLRDSTGGSTSLVPTAVTSTWQRISLTRTMAAGATSVRCIIGQTDGDILIYGAQLEAGAFATSYIPTTTTALTRNADFASMTGANFSSWYNASEGTLVADFTPVGAFVAARVAASLNDGSSANFMYLGTRNASATYGANNRVSSGTIVAIGSFGAANTSNQKATFAYSSAGQAVTFNAAAIATATETVPTVTQMNFGGITAVSASTHIRRIAYYPTRLPDATLQALTV